MRLALALLWTAPSAEAITEDAGLALPLPLGRNIPTHARKDLPRPIVQQNSFQVVLLSELDSIIDSFFDPVFGDTDRDGLNEIISEDKNGPWRTVILEEQGDDTYVALFPFGNSTSITPFATGDLDQDGKQEIIGQYGSALQVFESPAPSSFPTELVWQTLETNVLGYAVTGDTDRDGNMEIINSRNVLGGSGGLIIYENVGDNAYVEVYRTTLIGGSRDKVVADLDADGSPEIFVGTSYGDLYVFESCGDDCWVPVWIESTVLYYATAASGGWDTDGNGKEEVFIIGRNAAAPTWDALVYEANGDNSYQLVSTLSVPYPYTGHADDGIGDLDGDGTGEFFFRTDSVNVFKAVAAGHWEMVGIVSSSPNPSVVATYDVNGNGVWEFVWTGKPTWILEHPVASDAFAARSPVASLAVYPNPVRGSAQVTWSLPGAGATLGVYDVTGRLVNRRRVGGPPFDLSASDLAAGVYFLRLEHSGALLARGRITVNK